jgi:hypothetical protein
VLFTPRAYSGALLGLPVPGDPDSYPTKDEMADYLERYVGYCSTSAGPDGYRHSVPHASERWLLRKDRRRGDHRCQGSRAGYGGIPAARDPRDLAPAFA